MSGITYPVKPADIPKFETKNGIPVNLFGHEKKTLFPIHITQKKYDKHINLLLISKGKTSHYVWIKNMSCLLNKQSKDGHKYHVLLAYIH